MADRSVARDRARDRGRDRKRPREEEPARDRADELGPEEEEEVQPPAGGQADGLPAAAAAEAGLRQIAALTGKPPEGVTGVEPTEDG